MAGAKKLYIKTYGCQMNVYDSERMAEAWAAQGYVTTENADEADMVLLNTCHIREKAAEKVYSDLGRLRPLKEARPDLKIGVAGCVAQAEGGEILRADAAGRSGGRAAKLSPAARDDGGGAGGATRPVDTDFPAEDKFDHLPERPGAEAGADRLSDGAGGLRQVLRLLRGALYARRRGQPPGGAHPDRGARAGGEGRARDHAAGAERQCLAWRRGRAGRAGAPAGRDRGAGADPLYHLASQ